MGNAELTRLSACPSAARRRCRCRSRGRTPAARTNRLVEATLYNGCSRERVSDTIIQACRVADRCLRKERPLRTVTVQLRADDEIGTTDRRLFGAFIEHLGRCVYSGIFEPGHSTADSHGFRRDVLALVRQLAPTIVRYPGCNFASRYNWQDGVGPVSE